MSKPLRPPGEEPRSEPEIIPPDHSERGTERVRVYIAKPSPLGLILLTLIIGFLSAAGLVVLLGAFLFLSTLWVAEWGTSWIWELLIPMIVALSLMIGGAGRKWGVDALLARRYPKVPLW